MFFSLFWFCKNTNFESNSQHFIMSVMMYLSCFDSAKIQILKAIHNNGILGGKAEPVVLILQKYKFWKQFTTNRWRCFVRWSLFWFCKNTNFESNSQHRSRRFYTNSRCFDSAKIQILKAIHNGRNVIFKDIAVVLILQKYKFWKQFTTIRTVTRWD